jgi:purine-binding chemotaxis protein CheW
MGQLEKPSEAIREFVAFRCGGQEFCLDIMAVREIRSAAPATPLPHVPAYLRGLINLRGTVLPVIDFATRLGIASNAFSTQSVIIVAWIGSRLVGLEVDSVSDIITINASALQPAPVFVECSLQSFVRVVATVDNRMICVIALETLLPLDDIEAA